MLVTISPTPEVWKAESVNFIGKESYPNITSTLPRIELGISGIGSRDLTTAPTPPLFKEHSCLLLHRLLIEYTEDSSIVQWKGYVYAIAMAVAAITQSIFLHQYFHLALTIGMRLRTCILGLVYKKVSEVKEDVELKLLTKLVGTPRSVLQFIHLSIYPFLGPDIQKWVKSQGCDETLNYKSFI